MTFVPTFPWTHQQERTIEQSDGASAAELARDCGCTTEQVRARAAILGVTLTD